MNRVLILYPELFKCYSKFCRKLSNLLKNLETPELIFVDDFHEFGSKYALSHNLSYTVYSKSMIGNLDDYTHSIIFSDGEEFIDEVKALRDSSVKTSVQKILLTRVVNIKKDPVYNSKKNTEDYEYIGRGSPWGNPYPIGVDGDDRNEVLRKYQYDFDYDKFLNITKADMLELSGKRLGCFCKPEACHGDIIADYLNSYDDGK
ncbi:DUF4326 domain-containing protein [Vibrio sp. TRT 21S02]|uniref:DUF4326 domain-containing protein n=1 Tax=Vibrio sp. TRT 21S02 TaxID=3418507 RepID=UPI003CE7EBCD